MLKDITLGQFFPGDTFIHRLDPRTKLIAGCAFIVVLLCAKTAAALAVCAAFTALCLCSMRTPMEKGFGSMGIRLRSSI